MNTIILAFFVAIFWGISPVINKIILIDVSYHTIIFISGLTFFISSLFYCYIYKKQISIDLEIHKNKIIYIVIVAFFSLFLANLFYYNAIKYTNNVAIITSITALYPLITLILSYLILNEKMSLFNLLGIILIVIGVLFLIIK